MDKVFHIFSLDTNPKKAVIVGMEIEIMRSDALDTTPRANPSFFFRRKFHG